MRTEAPSKSGFSVDHIRVEPALLLAPMEDVTNLPFRLVAKRIGIPGLMFTEFVSAMAIHYGAAKTLKKLRVHPDERPLGVQIFGGDPEVMVETALLCESHGADLIDINMGCWVPKVCKTGSGAALIKNPELAERIVRAVVNAVRIPVTVKVRAGWDWSLFAAPDLARRFEAAGAKMLTLHARFAKQGFEGEADWRLIAELRKAVSIPLIGNGDVKTPEDAHRMLNETGCDGVMVGRAAISNPWALSRISASLQGLPEPEPPTLQDRVDIALEHLGRMVEYETEADPSGDPELRACRALRGQIPLYIKGAPGASAVRDQLTRCSKVAEFQGILQAFLNSTSL